MLYAVCSDGQLPAFVSAYVDHENLAPLPPAQPPNALRALVTQVLLRFCPSSAEVPEPRS